jgi:hypothetical protein
VHLSSAGLSESKRKKQDASFKKEVEAVQSSSNKLYNGETLNQAAQSTHFLIHPHPNQHYLFSVGVDFIDSPGKSQGPPQARVKRHQMLLGQTIVSHVNYATLTAATGARAARHHSSCGLGHEGATVFDLHSPQ